MTPEFLTEGFRGMNLARRGGEVIYLEAAIAIDTASTLFFLRFF